MHPARSTMYAKNVIRELFLKRQHKAKMVIVFIVGEMMVKRFERL
jgi:hypothetical protein